MTSERIGFFDVYVAQARQANPDISCPIRIARHVLECIGVRNMSDEEFEQFTQDLKLHNLQNTDIREEREVA